MTDTPELDQAELDFKDYPKSITEAKSDKDKNAASWRPRDALISFLRRLDAGEFPQLETLAIMAAWVEDGTTATHYSVSSPSFQHTLGMVELVKMKMYVDGKGS